MTDKILNPKLFDEGMEQAKEALRQLEELEKSIKA
jgi:hypothetical protein